jgi:TonB family protein
VTSSPPPEPLQIDGSLTAPRAVTTTAPAYTPEAREARIQGVVIVQAIINKEGNVTDVKVLKGLPLGLEESAVETIRTWKFEPATLEGKPVDVYYNLTVNFTIAEEEAS